MAAGGRGRQVLRSTSAGALAPRTAPRPRLFTELTSICAAICCLPLYTAGDDVRRAELSEALGELAQRILTFPEGKHEPSAPVQLLHQLTDEILVLAADAVDAVMAKQQPRPSGKAQFRLLGWTVADARGATTLLDNSLADQTTRRLSDGRNRGASAMSWVGVTVGW